MHHGLLASIVELIIIYSRRKQIVMSTHSDFVLDKIDPRNVYKVARDDQHGTLVTPHYRFDVAGRIISIERLS